MERKKWVDQILLAFYEVVVHSSPFFVFLFFLHLHQYLYDLKYNVYVF